MKRVYVIPKSSEIECLAAAILATSGLEKFDESNVDINMNGEPMDGTETFSLRKRRSIWDKAEDKD